MSFRHNAPLAALLALVACAGSARGEELSYYDTDIEYDCTCVGTSNEPRPKSDVEGGDEVTRTAKENGHPVVLFNWDPTGKNRERDLQEEPKKNPPDKNPAPAKKPGGAR